MTYCRGDVGFYGEVKEYMEMLQEEDPTKYEAHFSKYIEAGIDAEKMEDMYTEAHEKIREDPDGEKAEKKDQDTDTGHTAADDSETITSEPDELGFPLSSPSLPRPSPRSTPPMTPVSPPEPQPEPEAEKNVTSASSVESAMGSSGTDMPCQGCIDLGPCPCCGQMLRQKRKSRKRVH